MTFEIHVIDDEKRPQGGCSVEVHLPQSFPLTSEDDKITECTDENGCARFESADAGFGETSIYVNGENKGRFDLEDGAEFTVVV
jgi:hypothetical protein